MGPFEANPEEPPASPLARKHNPRSEFAAGLLHFSGCEAIDGHIGQDFLRSGKKSLNRLGVGGKLDGKHARVEKILVMTGGVVGCP